MALSLPELLKKSRFQVSAYSKHDLFDILTAADASSVGDSNVKLQSLIDKIAQLTTDIANLTTALNSHQETSRKQVDDMQAQLIKQSNIIIKQQLYLERIDRKERECNIVLLGVPEEGVALEGATSDTEKVSKVWEAASITCEIKSQKRLGQPGIYKDGTARRGPRPLLLVVGSQQDRDATLVKSKELNTPGKEAFKKIFIKKDVHPSVREEWKRLHDVVKAEKERDSEANIYLDFKGRKVMKDESVIDQWALQGF